MSEEADRPGKKRDPNKPIRSYTDLDEALSAEPELVDTTGVRVYRTEAGEPGEEDMEYMGEVQAGGENPSGDAPSESGAESAYPTEEMPSSEASTVSDSGSGEENERELAGMESGRWRAQGVRNVGADTQVWEIFLQR